MTRTAKLHQAGHMRPAGSVFETSELKTFFMPGLNFSNDKPKSQLVIANKNSDASRHTPSLASSQQIKKMV